MHCLFRISLNYSLIFGTYRDRKGYIILSCKGGIISDVCTLHTQYPNRFRDSWAPLSIAIGTFFRRFFLSHGLIQRLFIFTPVWGVGGKTPGIRENVLS